MKRLLTITAFAIQLATAHAADQHLLYLSVPDAAQKGGTGN